MTHVVLMCAPALIAVLAVIGAVQTYGRLEGASPRRKAWLWLTISLMSLLAFGIGSCYGMVFLG